MDRSMRGIGSRNPLRRPVLHSNPTESNILTHSRRNQLRRDPDTMGNNASTDSLRPSKSLSSPNLHKLGRSELTHGTGSTIKDRPLPQYEAGFYFPNHSSDTLNEEEEEDQDTIDTENNTGNSNVQNSSRNDNDKNSLGSAFSRRRKNPNLIHYENDESLLVDVLPSFDMYNVLHRHIPQGNVDPDRHDFPPTYEEESTHTLEPPAEIHPHDNSISNNHHHLPNQRIDSNVHQESIDIHDLRPLNTLRYNISNNIPFEDDLNDADNIVIDKVYSLPKLVTPIEIEIHITKNAPKPDIKVPDESILKEYTSGDIIHGYCTIHNKSPNRLKFEMFYVTLEGYISIIDRQQGKRTVKRFLRMVDLSASWSYTNIDLSSGIDIKVGETDKEDGAIIGLNNSRILEPNMKYKKIFMFKLPTQLLDVSCKHEQYSHCLLPPSFGIDKFKDHGKYAGIRINSVLGCGHLGSKGSPILTRDLSDDDISINYTIDARIVGKDPKSHKLNIMKEREYNLRVMPFEFGSSLKTESKASKKQLKDLERLIQERLDALAKIMKKVENNEQICNSDIHVDDLSGNFDNNDELDSHDILRRKMDQLHINNRLDDARNIYELSDFKCLAPTQNSVETEISYKYKSKSKLKSKSKSKSSGKSSGFFSGFITSASSSLSLTAISSSSTELKNSLTPTKSGNHSSTTGITKSADHIDKITPNNDSSKSIPSGSNSNVSLSAPIITSPSLTSSSQSEKSGLLVISANIPVRSIPYWSPSIIRKANKMENKNRHDQENWARLAQLVSENERDILKNLPIKITCIESNNSIPHDPPPIQSITTQLIVITGRSDFSIPIKLSVDMLSDDKRLNNIKKTFHSYRQQVSNYQTRFQEQREKINKLYNLGTSSNNKKVLHFKDFISDQIKSDIESLSNIEVRCDILNEIFKKQPSSTTQTSHSPIRHLDGTLSPERRRDTVMSSPIHNNTEENSAIGKGWSQVGTQEFERFVLADLEMTRDIGETLIPSFESCLCCRFYAIRVNIKFDSHIGSASLDIPINVKKMNI
uniref:BUL2 n=1 Tax=Maudiozyma exigua TaxID=34358 RepID=Q876A8_MAUEX|nr:BUL2 [Kazachstania exigua]